jgi:hypothetical protein
MDRHRKVRTVGRRSSFICVHLWLIKLGVRDKSDCLMAAPSTIRLRSTFFTLIVGFLVGICDHLRNLR